MKTTAIKRFVPNCAFAPADKMWEDSEGEHIETKDATLLMLDGTNEGDLYTQENWEKGGEPSYQRVGQRFLNMDGSPIDKEVGKVVLLPQLHVVKIYERHYWTDEKVLARTSKIFGVYIFDKTQHFHLCSMTPSYELHFLGSQYEFDKDNDLTDAEQEELFDLIREGDIHCESVSYMNVSDVDRIEKECRYGFLPKGKNGGFKLQTNLIFSNEAIEAAREYYCQQEF